MEIKNHTNYWNITVNNHIDKLIVSKNGISIPNQFNSLKFLMKKILTNN